MRPDDELDDGLAKARKIAIGFLAVVTDQAGDLDSPVDTAAVAYASALMLCAVSRDAECASDSLAVVMKMIESTGGWEELALLFETMH